ncbi:MAG: FeoB-associated Cys-rich membrane protein [Lachnospiraceae bacterium]|nr:FeoB-associated Cys-rich membrane protein [Lachnospiraceae bacterium]
MNHWDIIIIIAIAIAVALAVIKIIKKKKAGKSSCGFDCSSCAGCQMHCHDDK